MPRRIAYISCFLLLSLQLLLSSTASAAHLQSNAIDNPVVPVVDPDYIYSQLFYMVTHYQGREAGYDNSLPVNVNGHDEFAAYWTQEMMRNLQDFGAQVRRDPFHIQGWQGRPATVPAFNVEVTVPGITNPEQIVVIGCHYDGEAISNQSAFDDGSGCAIELGVARAMSAYWHATHTYPARTLRFVIYDAEEQGLYGSFHYLNATINGDIPNIVAMFNEEQNGIAYPLRYLGKASNPLYPFYISLAPLQNNSSYPDQSKLSQQQLAAIAHFRLLMQQAVAPTFALFRSEGFQNLTYHTASGQDVAQPIFTPDQTSNVSIQDDPGLGSDQIPFTLAGLPAATFIGNYQPDPKYPQIPGYPFDTPVDTIQLMNTFADGSSQQSQALTLALALPGQLTAWMLSQPDIVGATPPDGKPIAAISDIGQTIVDQSITLDANASFDPPQRGTPLSYSWNFGDGVTANGITVQHSYHTTDRYTLSLTVHAASSARTINKIIVVTGAAHTLNNPFSSFHFNGIIPTPPGMPRPDNTLRDAVTPHSLAIATSSPTQAITPSPTQTTTPSPTQTSHGFFSSPALVVIVVLVVIALAEFLLIRRRRKAITPP